MATLLLIFSCHQYAEKRALQKRTWLPRVSVPYLHVVGELSQTEPWRLDKDAALLSVRVADDYVSLPQKVVAAFEAVLGLFPEVQYVFKTDDDQCLDEVTFLHLLASRLPRQDAIHYGGQMLSVEPHFSQYHLVHPELSPTLFLERTTYATGRFYFLSRAALAALVEQKALFAAEQLEDYAVGYLLPGQFKRRAMSLPSQKYFVDQR